MGGLQSPRWVAWIRRNTQNEDKNDDMSTFKNENEDKNDDMSTFKNENK